jgi:hypothetical protein
MDGLAQGKPFPWSDEFPPPRGSTNRKHSFRPARNSLQTKSIAGRRDRATD